MNINILYRKIPVEERICEGCGDPIERNLAVLDGKLYHYGCLKRTRAKPVAVCLDCWSYLSGKNITKASFDGRAVRGCGECGSSNLRFLNS
jgi:hypothetical protein